MSTRAASTSVGSVLRASKLARFDPRLPQVYTHVMGDWGAVKAPVPAKLPAQHLTFRALDSKFHVPDFRTADAKVQAVARITEQLPTAILPDTPRLGRADATNLADLSDAQFRAWLRTVGPRNLTDPKTWGRDLNVTMEPAKINRDARVKGPVYTAVRHHDSNAGETDAAGTPSNYMATRTVVHGRVLNSHGTDSATVALSGFVVDYEGNNSNLNKKLVEFEVDHATWDRAGRPIIKLAERLHQIKGTRLDVDRRFTRGPRPLGAAGANPPEASAVQGLLAKLKINNLAAGSVTPTAYAQKKVAAAASSVSRAKSEE
ncbi:hypothetical protein H9P43_004714 [Blastocladiella emersonii ATCC 22665]|nr:hypothetical protein H9P43_004714 [Blastocladiella emersonii ATCC 22665]